MSNFDLTPEEADKVLRDELNDVIADMDDATVDSYAAIDGLMKASDYESSDIFTPPDNVPFISQEEHADLAAQVAGQARSWDIALGNAKNRLTAADVEHVYAQVGLKEAQTLVVHQQTANEGLRLIEMTKTGELIAARTQGVVIATQLQGVKNTAAIQMVSLEAEYAQAAIEGAVAKINATRAKTDTLLLEIEAKQMKAAGVEGSYEYQPSNIR